MAFAERFSAYFDRPAAQTAAKSISNGAEIEFRVGALEAGETFTFTRQAGRNAILAQPAREPHLIFTLSPAAAEDILNFASDDIGEIGVHIAKLVVSRDPERKISLAIKTGFFTLFTKGYLGVIATGGGHFASFLATQGLNGMGAIKTLLSRKQ